MMSTMSYPASASAYTTSFFQSPSSASSFMSASLIPEEYPPSSSPGDPFRPNIELSKAVYQVDPRLPTISVSGEIELDVSLFRDMPFSIGIGLTTPELAAAGDKPIEWNQDPHHTAYHRSRSFIRMDNRLVVDNTCYLKFSIELPASLCSMMTKVFTVDVRAYALARPEVATKPSSVQFMVMGPALAGASGKRSANYVLSEARSGRRATLL